MGIEIVIAGVSHAHRTKKSIKTLSGKVIVKSQGETYAEILKDIKTNEGVDSLGVKVKNKKD